MGWFVCVLSNVPLLQVLCTGKMAGPFRKQFKLRKYLAEKRKTRREEKGMDMAVLFIAHSSEVHRNEIIVIRGSRSSGCHTNEVQKEC